MPHFIICVITLSPEVAFSQGKVTRYPSGTRHQSSSDSLLLGTPFAKLNRSSSKNPLDCRLLNDLVSWSNFWHDPRISSPPHQCHPPKAMTNWTTYSKQHIFIYYRLSICRGYIWYDSADNTQIIRVKLWSDLHSRRTSHTSPLRARYGVSFVSFATKNYGDISRTHCNVHFCPSQAITNLDHIHRHVGIMSLDNAIGLRFPFVSQLMCSFQTY